MYSLWTDASEEAQGAASDGPNDAYVPSENENDSEEEVMDDSGDEEAAKTMKGGKKKGDLRKAVAGKREFLIEKKRPNSENQ